MTTTPPLGDVGELIGLLQGLAAVPSEGGDYSELDHGLQCAAELAHQAPDDIELQVAGLVHDVGHAFGDDESHGRAGRHAVAGLLGDRIGRLVEAHVPAKRYLVTTDAAYRRTLSAESTISLAVQGGALNAAELAAWQAQPSWDEAVVLRRADDAAKVPGRVVPGLDHWVPALQRIAATRAEAPR